MAHQNLVSIITPIYNSALFLDDTIKSILKQTYENFELILIDDSSTDESIEIAKKYIERDPRIILLCLPGNSGAAVARNAGIEIAKGRYIAFCDSDDIWLPSKLEAQLSTFEHTRAAICFTSYFKMRESGELTDSQVKAKKRVVYKDILRSNYIGCSTAIYAVDVCGKCFMPNVRRKQDYGLWINILKYGHEAVGLTEPFVHYRVRKASVSSNKMSAAAYHWVALRDFAGLGVFRRSVYFIQYALLGFIKKMR